MIMYSRSLLLTGITVFVLGGIALAFYVSKTPSQTPRPRPRRSDEDEDHEEKKLDDEELQRRKLESAQRAALKAEQGQIPSLSQSCPCSFLFLRC